MFLWSLCDVVMGRCDLHMRIWWMDQADDDEARHVVYYVLCVERLLVVSYCRISLVVV